MESATGLEERIDSKKAKRTSEAKERRGREGGGCSLNSKNNSIANGYPDHRSREVKKGKREKERS